jgi:hypothetical protein
MLKDATDSAANSLIHWAKKGSSKRIRKLRQTSLRPWSRSRIRSLPGIPESQLQQHLPRGHILGVMSRKDRLRA